MDQPIPLSQLPASRRSPAPEPPTRLPVDLEEDPVDESIYSTAYRLRTGAIVREWGPAPAGPTGGESPRDRSRG